MTALERVRDITGRLDKVLEARQYAKEAEDLQNKLDLLSQRCGEVTTAIGPTVVLVSNAAMDRQRMPDLERTRQALQRVSETFEGTAQSLTGGRNLRTLLNNLESSTASIADETKAAWNEHSATVPKVSEPLLHRIEQISTQAHAVGQIRSAVSELRRCARFPSTQDEWDAFSRARKKVEVLVDKLDPSNFPKAVLEFCKAAQGGGATLDMLTDDVRKWLDEHGMINNLRYRLL